MNVLTYCACIERSVTLSALMDNTLKSENYLNI